MLFTAVDVALASSTPTATMLHTAYTIFPGRAARGDVRPGHRDLERAPAELGLPGIKDLDDVHDACALAIVAVPKEFEPDVPDAANVPLSAPCSMRLRCPPTSKRSTSAAQAALRAGGCRRGPGSGQLMSVIASIED